MAFAEKYRDAFRDLGLWVSRGDGLGDLPRQVGGGGFAIPQALLEYYAACGRHEMNTRHNRLLLPREVYVLDDRLVFMEEHQGAFVWAVFADDPNDPEVFQGVKAVGVPELEWYSEDLALSDFIVAMWRWQVTGEEPARRGPQ